jgi:photoactive yellow protein
MAVTRVNIDVDSLVSEIGSLTADDLDLLPFGAIQLDANGVILAYNKSEEKLAGRKAEDVIGKNFFRDIAPCTRVKRFYGAFQTGVDRRELNEVFDFTFKFPHGDREVRIRMIYSATPKPAVWIFVTPIARG